MNASFDQLLYSTMEKNDMKTDEGYKFQLFG